MNITYILYNHLAGSKEKNEGRLESLTESLSGEETKLVDVAELESYEGFFCDLDSSDKVYICGGDGTLNRFINGSPDGYVPCEVYYYSMGTGNDFLNDIGLTRDDTPVLINKYLEDLPIVTVNGVTRRFINNVGFGIDGYCCEVGDKQKETSDKPVNYTMIAIGGLLGGYYPTNAVVTVDGKKYLYDRVWIAPTMNGRYYGGGMMAAPEQDRLNEEREVSLVLMYGAGKVKTLTMFPSIFSGGHLKYTNNVTVHKGHSIKVEFDRPTALQIDGETVLGVVTYQVESCKRED